MCPGSIHPDPVMAIMGNTGIQQTTVISETIVPFQLCTNCLVRPFPVIVTRPPCGKPTPLRSGLPSLVRRNLTGLLTQSSDLILHFGDELELQVGPYHLTSIVGRPHVLWLNGNKALKDRFTVFQVCLKTAARCSNKQWKRFPWL